MRTKLVLAAALLAASLATSMAQNVYSLNVVGYVNVTLPANQFSGVANPLDASVGVVNGNDITNLFSIAAGNIAGGSSLATWNSTAVDWNTAITFNAKSSSWGGNFPMPPGVGALYYNNGGVDTVVTFVGEVKQGTYNVNNMAANAFTMAGQPVPLGGDVSTLNTALGLVPTGGDSVATFNGTAVDWNTAVVWNAKGSAWGAPLAIAPGQGFLYYNNNGAVNAWTSNFTVQ